MLKSGTLYSGPCVLLDANGNARYAGVFCKEPDLQIEVTLNGTYTQQSSVFEAEVRVDCNPHIVLPNLNQTYAMSTLFPQIDILGTPLILF